MQRRVSLPPNHSVRAAVAGKKPRFCAYNANSALVNYSFEEVNGTVANHLTDLVPVNELRVFVPRSRRKSSVGRRGRSALLGAGRIWKFQAGGSDVEAAGAGETA